MNKPIKITTVILWIIVFLVTGPIGLIALGVYTYASHKKWINL